MADKRKWTPAPDSAATTTTTTTEEDSGSTKKGQPQGPLDYVLMSVPAKSPEELNAVWNQHVELVTREKIGRSAKFEIPDLPVGTFDSLMTISDELGRIDQFAENLCRKIISTLTELYSASSCLFLYFFFPFISCVLSHSLFFLR